MSLLNLLKKISNDDVIIFQYEAYGFQKKGVPLWLLKDLKNKFYCFRV